MNTIDAIKDAATEIIAELKQWADWFGVDNEMVTESKWEQEWQALTAAAKKAEMEHGLLTGDDLAALCALANDMMAALWGKPAATPWGRTSVDVTWFEDDAEGESSETTWERAEYGQLTCCLVSDSAADQRTEQGRKAYTRGERMMASLAEMVHVPAGTHDRDGVNEWLPLTWNK